jgi:hypothetical protein
MRNDAGKGIIEGEVADLQLPRPSLTSLNGRVETRGKKTQMRCPRPHIFSLNITDLTRRQALSLGTSLSSFNSVFYFLKEAANIRDTDEFHFSILTEKIRKR